jgi:hypothetical protein
VIETKSSDDGAENLSGPVEDIVESTSAGVEVRAVETICSM